MFAHVLPRFRYVARRGLRNGLIAVLFAVSPVAGGTVTVVALGDSLTAGYGLPREEGLVPQLQAWLDARGADATLINAGVSGDTTAGGLARLEWSLTPDVDAMIVTLGGNDLLRGIDPQRSRANLAAILQGAATRGLPVLLVGLRAPANYGPAFKTEFDAIYPELAAQYGALLVPDFFAAIRTTGENPMIDQSFMQGDGLHPTAQGIARIVARLGPQVRLLLGEVAQ